MLSTDIYMHTAVQVHPQRSPRRNQSHLTINTKSDSKSDVMRALDELTSKFKKRTSWLDSAASSNSSHSSSRRGKPDLSYPTHDLPRHFQEPSTPEEQIFGGFHHHNMNTPNTVPELTPDNLFGGVSASKKSGLSRRKPVNQEFFGGESPIKPLVLQGLNQTNAPSKFAPGELCGFCDMSLNATFKSETAVRMQCGHAAHRECRDNLVRVCLEYDDEVLTCPICDGAVMTPEFNPKLLPAFEFLTTKGEADNASRTGTSRPSMNDISASRLAADSSCTNALALSDKTQPETLAQILTPHIQAVIPKPESKASNGRRSLKDALKSSVSSASSSLQFNVEGEPNSLRRSVSIDSLLSETGAGAQDSSNDSISRPQSQISSEVGLYNQKIDELWRSDLTKSVTCKMESFTINATGYISQGSKENSKVSQVALWVQAPDDSSRVYLSEERGTKLRLGAQYHTTAKDIQYAIRCKREVESLSYKGNLLKSVLNGILRLYSEVRVTSPDREFLDWPATHAYLFEKSLILVTAPNNRVRAVLDAAAAIESVEAHTKDPTVVRLKPTDPKIPELHFHTESRSVVRMWMTAFEVPTAQFPLHPSNYNTYLENKETELELNGGIPPSPSIGRAPAELVVCVPHHIASSSSAVQLAISNAIAELQPCDRLALILYSSDGIKNCVSLQHSYWSGWKCVLDELKSTKSRAIQNPHSISNSYAAEPSSSKPVKTFDQVMCSIREVLENHNINKSAASVLLVSDDDTKLGVLPPEFQIAKIPINCIGLTENHDALTLSTLARSTSGNYAYSKSIDGVGPLFTRIVKLETQYTMREVAVRLRSRINTEIKNFRQTFLDEDRNIKFSDAETRTVEWHLGKMRRGDLRSLIFDVEGEVPQNQPIVQVSIDCVDALGIERSTTSFRLDAPAASIENTDSAKRIMLPQSMFESECVLASSFKVFEDVLASLITENNRKAFQYLSEGLNSIRERLDDISGSNAADLVYKRILEILEQLFDQRCDAIIEHKLLTKDFVLESLQQLWLFSSRRSLALRDSLEQFYA